MNIPDKAVEAAARVFYASQTGGDNLDSSYNRQAWLNVAELALADAAPFIAAQALRDFADAHRIPFYLFVGDRERVSVNDMIRLCAAELDPQ